MKWSFENAFYFTIGTITTVGYGNLAPGSDTSKMFTVLYALSGIITLGVVLGLVGLWIVKQTQIGHAELQQLREIERLDTFAQCADPRWEKKARQSARLRSTRSSSAVFTLVQACARPRVRAFSPGATTSARVSTAR